MGLSGMRCILPRLRLLSLGATACVELSRADLNRPDMSRADLNHADLNRGLNRDLNRAPSSADLLESC